MNPSNRCKTYPSPIFEAAKDLEIDLGPIRLNEVIDVVRNLKNGKASGRDEISAEMLKAHDGIAQVFWNLIEKSWKRDHLPEDWIVAQIVQQYKNKEKRTECSKYQGISLLSVPKKMFATVTLNRCKETLDKVLREKQCDFRKSRGCTEQLFAVRQIIEEKALLYQVDLILCVFGFRAAFDSVERDRMYEMVRHYGLPVEIVNNIENSYDGFKCRVKSEGMVGDTFDVRAGVRQGDAWSSLLFGHVINYVLENSVFGGIDIGQYVAEFEFADDVALVRNCHRMLRRTYIGLKKLL